MRGGLLGDEGHLVDYFVGVLVEHRGTGKVF